MRITQRLVSTAGLAFALTASLATAQQQTTSPQTDVRSHHHHRHHRTHDPHKQAAKMSRRLNLSPDQTARIEPILATRQQKMEALKADTTLTPEARRAQVRAIHEQTKQQFAQVLTPEQAQQFKGMGHHHGQRHGEAPAPSASSGV